MKFRTLTLFFWVFLIAGAAIASEERRTRIETEVGASATAGQEKIVDRRNNDDEAKHMRRTHEIRIIRQDADVTD